MDYVLKITKRQLFYRRRFNANANNLSKYPFLNIKHYYAYLTEKPAKTQKIHLSQQFVPVNIRNAF